MQHSDLTLEEQIDLDSITPESQPSLSWQSIGKTHAGRVRYLNEDAFLDTPEHRLWAVADGMGGHKRGDYASKTVISHLESFSKLESLSSTLQDIESRLLSANEHCQTTFKGKKMGSTIATLLESDQHCFFIWAGDSRIYRLREGELRLMTEDHSVAQEKQARGEFNSEEASKHPSAHVLTRAVGVHRRLKLELRHCQALAGDRYLICSDGLYNDLSFDDIQTFLKYDSYEESLDKLMQGALDKGGRDNITAIIVEATA